MNPGPSQFGLLEVIPEDETGRYSANMIRYGMKAPQDVYTSEYSFGMYFQLLAGQTKTQAMPVWSVGGAENWVEVSNVGDGESKVEFQLYDSQGSVLNVWNAKIPGRSTMHYNISSLLPDSSTATVRLNPLRGEIIAQSLVYYRWLNGSINSSLAMQSREPTNL
ncbi:hypothetical protein RZS08_18470, partial [Arthrospira platensis SPKY1]|nr:hypothetical protein [Arthrospira platensis SPKY1]